MNLSLVDGEVNALEDLLPRLGNHGRQVPDLEQELLAPAALDGRRRAVGGREGGPDGAPPERDGAEGPEAAAGRRPSPAGKERRESAAAAAAVGGGRRGRSRGGERRWS